MELPAITKQHLKSAASRDDLIRETAAQIIKDFGEFNLDISFSGNTGNFYLELSQQMVGHVSDMLANNHSRFLGLMYRIDIDNNQIRQYEMDMPNNTYPEIITELIIHRELKKVLIREYFRQQDKKD
ncbi:hypothetical protein [Alkalitalea saponilacus]|uniref:Uncharacterized protein n=1 Tax=Alkalitalea saponilacus TaxID=889453 RepID=A0A1T5FW66_9BACT|nr:hypothetical protein [Alkalitalea saponilacus]ASB49510.1 hypothetical protein CDL62_10350 [Alkalitalea saponilacus]SKC00418.1 hypothetical protein SAMN03080601_01704 [Alkalitalea saponilacus]